MPDLDTVLERWIPRVSGSVNPHFPDNGSLRPHDVFVIALQECPSKFKVRGKEVKGGGREGKEREEEEEAAIICTAWIDCRLRGSFENVKTTMRVQCVKGSETATSLISHTFY